MRYIKSFLNWRIKILAKLILAHLPIPYGFWKRMALFEHGFMDDPEYVLRVFKQHYERVDFDSKDQGWVGLELGPGDSIASGLVAHAYGARTTYLVDVGDFATRDVSAYRGIIAYLQKKGLQISDLPDNANFEDMLAFYNVIYVTNGNQSLESLDDQNIDFCWSQAVLEHVRKDDFKPMLKELSRITKVSGAHSHRIDLQDHLANSLHNLRFSERFWEADWVAQAGFYTNRIRYSDMVSLFQNAGFNCNTVHTDAWEALPLERSKLYEDFQGMSDENLLVSGFDMTASLMQGTQRKVA